jgi:hypothetical protein
VSAKRFEAALRMLSRNRGVREGMEIEDRFPRKSGDSKECGLECSYSRKEGKLSDAQRSFGGKMRTVVLRWWW